MKRIIPILLCAAMLLCLCACAEKTPASKDPAEEVPQEQIDERPSLWGKKITMEQTEIPEAAFSTGAERCVAISPDGGRFLMGRGIAPTLYDLESGKFIPLIPGDEETEEVARYACVSKTILSQMTDEQRTAYQDRIASLSGAALTEEFFSDHGALLQPQHLHVYQTDGNWMFLRNAVSGAPMALDCDTGKYYLSDPRSEGNPCAVRSGKLLLRGSGAPILRIRDLSSGSTEEIDMDLPDVFPEGCYIVGASFLPDGRVCAVLGDQRFSEDGVEHVLAVCAPGGKAELCCTLGTYVYAKAPDLLIPVGKRYVAAFFSNVGGTYREAAQLIDLEEKSSLRFYLTQSGSLEYAAADVWETMAESGETPGRAMMFLSCMADGETLLLQDLESGGDLLLYRPTEPTVQYLLGRAGIGAPMIQYISGNGYDAWVYQAGLEDAVYCRLKVEE